MTLDGKIVDRDMKAGEEREGYLYKGFMESLTFQHPT